MVDVAKREDRLLDKISSLMDARERTVLRMADICEQHPDLMVELSGILNGKK